MKLKVKRILALLASLVITASLVVGILLIPQKQQTSTKAGGVDLNLSSNNNNPQSGDTFTVAISMNTNGLNVTAVDLKLNYDPNVLTATQIIPAGTSLPGVVYPGAITANSARIALVISDYSSGGINGSNLLLSEVTFKALNKNSTSITFNPETLVATFESNYNSVGAMPPLQLNGGVTSYLLSGTVTASGLSDVMQRGSIKITNLDSRKIKYPAIALDGFGHYNINLPPANYKISAGVPGYFNSTQNINLNQNTILNFTLTSKK